MKNAITLHCAVCKKPSVRDEEQGKTHFFKRLIIPQKIRKLIFRGPRILLYPAWVYATFLSNFCTKNRDIWMKNAKTPLSTLA